MSKSLNRVLKSLKDSNFFDGVSNNGTTICKSVLLENGFKLKERILKHLLKTRINWSTECSVVDAYKKSIESSKISFLQKIEVENSYQHVYNKNLTDMANGVALKIMSNNSGKHISEESLFSGLTTKTVLLTDLFVSAENELFRYNNLQRERKVWWMKYSANPSRYSVNPSQLKPSNNEYGEVCKESKLVSIKANFEHGSVDVENIFLIPLHKIGHSSDNCVKISLIRSVVNLDLATSSLILDSSMFRTGNENYSLMLNRKLAPYQIMLANMHEQCQLVDELTMHLQHVLRKTGLRLYDKFMHSNSHLELDNTLLKSDSCGIPYLLLIDKESLKSGFIKMRSRDTTLFETIHVSDIPSYLINIFKN